MNSSNIIPNGYDDLCFYKYVPWLSFVGLYVNTNGTIKEVDLETEIHIGKVKNHINSLGANKENETALNRVTGVWSDYFYHFS